MKTDDTQVETLTRPARLNLNLSQKSRQELDGLANSCDCTITQLVTFALSLLKLYFDSHRRGEKLVITDSNYEVKKEIVAPWL